MKTLQSVINDFLDNIDQYDDDVLEALSHLIDVELMERDYLANPQNFKREDDDVN
jgi:hypothetical protein